MTIKENTALCAIDTALSNDELEAEQTASDKSTRWNDATIVGDLTNPETQAVLNSNLVLMVGDYETAGNRWMRIDGSIKGILDHKLTHHPEVVEKDGEGIVFGTSKLATRVRTRGGVTITQYTHRSKSKMKSVTAIAIDVDGTAKISAVRDRLVELGWCAVLYTTHSHAAKKTQFGDRFRIIIFLATPHPLPMSDDSMDEATQVAERSAVIDDYERRYAGVVTELGLTEVDYAGLSPNQMMYTPRRPSRDAEFEHYFIAGAALHLEDVPLGDVNKLKLTGKVKSKVVRKPNSNGNSRKSACQGDPVGFEEHLALIGDGEDMCGFDAPIYSAALSYFACGEDDEGALIVTLRDAILAATCYDDRAARRYVTDDYLVNRVEQAREYINAQDADNDDQPDVDNIADADTSQDGANVEPANTISLNIADPLGKKLSVALETLKARWAVVNVGGKVLFMPRPDPDHASDGVQFFSEAEFIKFHKNRFVVKKGKRVQPAKVFAEEADRYAEVTFAPTPVVAMRHSFNLWNGFQVDKKAPSGATCEKLKVFIRDVICGGREDLFQWLWLWLAHCAQKPGEKPGTALVIQGTGGCGKSYFGTVLTRLFSPYTVFADREDHVTGKFNRHLATAVLLVSDEALFGGDNRVSGLIKSLVTTNVQRIEAKGVDSIEVQSFLRCVFVGNPKRVVPIEANGSDRRYLCLTVADTYKDDTDYFAEIEAEIAAGGLEALFGELAAYDPAENDQKWSEVRVAPETDEKKKMRRLSLPKVVRKMIEAVEDRVLEFRDESGRAIRYVLHEAGANYVARDHMRHAISKWADSRDGGQDANEVLADLFGDDVTTTRRKAVFEQRVGYDGEWEDAERKKAHCYVLPSQARMIELVTHRFAD